MVATVALTTDELLATTRAVRRRLDFERPVPLEVIRECLELALQAPSGSNKQSWQFVVVVDEAKRRALADLYRRSFADYARMPGNIWTAYDGDDTARLVVQQRSGDSAAYLAENMHRAPALLVPCHPGRMDGLPAIAAASICGSVLPAVWSFCLAARSRGLGTAWTTLHLRFEREAAEVLGIPYEEVTQLALLPVAYTQGTDFRPGHRAALDTVLHVDTW
jgi:nitroreductase